MMRWWGIFARIVGGEAEAILYHLITLKHPDRLTKLPSYNTI